MTQPVRTVLFSLLLAAAAVCIAPNATFAQDEDPALQAALKLQQQRVAAARALIGQPIPGISYEIDADASRDDIAAVVAQSQKRSAVFDILTNPTNVQVSVV